MFRLPIILIQAKKTAFPFLRQNPPPDFDGIFPGFVGSLDAKQDSGTNENFFTLLALCAGIANNQSDTHYLYNRMGIEEGANALNFYLSYCTQIPVNAVYGCGNNYAVQQAVAQRIGMAMRPIIAAHFAAYPYNGDGNHTVIVYGYGADSVNGSTVYLCHNGAYGQHILWISASWFADYLYINN